MGWFSDRRALVELRGLRRAAERIADALELQVQTGPRDSRSFRGFSRSKHEEADHSGVSYTDAAELVEIERHRRELTALYGREPDADELARALRGDVE